MKKIIAVAALIAVLTSSKAMAQQDNPDLRLDLLKVTLAAETDHFDEAFSRLKQLKKKYPNNKYVLLAEAELNLKIGNRGKTVALLNKASSLDPGDEDVSDRKRAALNIYRPYISAGSDFQHSENANEFFTRASGQSQVMPMVTTSATIENNHLETRNGGFQRSNGTIGEFNGDKQRGTFSLDKIFDSGNEAGASVFAANEVIGAGVHYSWWDSLGVTTLETKLHYPDWSYVESVIEDGTKDNIRISRSQHINNQLEVALSGGVNRYGLDGDVNVADSYEVNGTIGYTLPTFLPESKGEDIVFGANYTLDAEYFKDVEDRIDPSGATFNPLPVKSYEIHTINISASKELLDQAVIYGFAGYGVDRLGDNGPVFGGSFKYNIISNLGLEVYASRSLLSTRSNGDIERVGVDLKYFW